MFDVRYHVHMTTKTTVSITEARKRIFDIAEQVQRPNVYYTLTDKGRPKVVVMSAEEFESWAETLEVIKDFPHLADDAKQAMKEYREGNYVLLEDLPNVVPSSHPKKGAKRARSRR
ncbi:MAG TPA: hypothetical protein DEP50_07920 [Acinetobacter lwoffii]|nr:hypothetical protein [Acinetobacter lwoffii]